MIVRKNELIVVTKSRSNRQYNLKTFLKYFGLHQNCLQRREILIYSKNF